MIKVIWPDKPGNEQRNTDRITLVTESDAKCAELENALCEDWLMSTLAVETEVPLAGMAPTGKALAGPVFNASGLKLWYLVCTPESIVAVPYGLWTSMVLSQANSLAAAAMFGLVGAFLSSKGKSARTRIETELEGAHPAQLRMKPNVFLPVSQIVGIRFKGEKWAKGQPGALITPDIILETKTGGKRKFGIYGPDFQKASAELRRMYPALCKSI